MVLEKDGMGFLHLEIEEKYTEPTCFEDLDVLECHTHTPRYVGAEGRRISQPCNDRSKIHA